MRNEIPRNWKQFLNDLDSELDRETSLVCIGGFVIAMCYDFDRETSDLDFISCIPNEENNELLLFAGEGSALHEKHGVYLQQVTIAQMTECYEDRLTEMFPGRFNNLRLYALEVYDLALSKLTRNSEKDREDLLRMVNSEEFNLHEFEERYDKEFRVYVEDTRHRTTFRFWLNLIREYLDENEG